MIAIRISLLRSMMHVRHHIHKKLSTAQIDNWMMIRSLSIATKKILKKRKRRGKMQDKVKWLGYPKDQSSLNRRKIFWINVLSNILSMANGEISENPVTFESHFPFASFCVNVVSAK